MREKRSHKRRSKDSRGGHASVRKGNAARRFGVLLAVLMTAGVCLTAPAQKALADDTDVVGAQVSIPVTCDFKPDGEWDGEFLIAIEAVTDGAPLPDGTLTLKAGESGVLGPMTYTKAGDYTYRVYEQSENTDDWKIDDTVYEVTVRIVYDIEGNPVGSMWIGTADEPDKTTSLTFVNERTNVKDAGRTPAPDETEEPDASKEPDGTNAPKQSEAPDGTNAPKQSEAPKSSGGKDGNSGSAISKVINAIKTGDDAAVTGCVLLAVSAAALLLFLLLHKRNKEA